MAFTGDSTINDILANEKAKAVVEKYVPGFTTHPELAMVKSMSLKAVALFPEANISSDKLAAIIEDLSKVE
ncbi:hypothetical protein ES703_118264 [subsurface metagenome]